MAVLRVCFILRRKAAEEKKGLGRIAERMLCSCKLRLRRASPTVGLHSCHRALLGLRRLHAGGAKTLELQGPLRVFFFLRRKAAEEQKGLGADRRAHAL